MSDAPANKLPAFEIDVKTGRFSGHIPTVPQVQSSNKYVVQTSDNGVDAAGSEIEPSEVIRSSQKEEIADDTAEMSNKEEDKEITDVELGDAASSEQGQEEKGKGGDGGEEKGEEGEEGGKEGEDEDEEGGCCGFDWHRCKLKIAYKMDNWISQRENQFKLVVYLFVIAMFVFVGPYHAVNDEYFSPRFWNDDLQFVKMEWYDSLFETYAFLMDPGGGLEVESPEQRFVAAIISWFGVVIFSILVGFVIDAVMEKMEDLKKGRSTVVEDEHTLILGWTDKAGGVCIEVANANESEGGGVIVVLDSQEKEELEATFENQVDSDAMAPDGNLTRVVFRSGTPLRSTDLMRVSALKARSIVILSDYGQEPDLADADILRVLLTLQTLPGKLSGHVVCEVRDVDNEPLVALVGGDVCETVVSHDIIGRLMLMAARQPGIARVYNSILGFDDDEFYTEDWNDHEHSITGKTWGDIIMSFPMAIPMGYAREDGSVELNPRKDHVFVEGDELIVIAEDDDTYEPNETCFPEVEIIPEPIPEIGDPEKILFCGWRRDVRDMMLLLDTMVAPGSELHMFNEKPNEPGERTKILLEDGFDVNELNNMKLVHWHGNSAVKRHLQPVPLDEYSVAMILADQEKENDMMHSDSHSLSSLLLIRDIQERKNIERRLRAERAGQPFEQLDCAVVCEILDSRTQETISKNEKVSLSSDFVQSNQMVSQILAMVSEDRNVKSILGELLGASGASIVVKPVCGFLCEEDEELSFWQLQKRAIAWDKTLLGYQGRTALDETVINPKDKEVVKKWNDLDIVLMEGHTEAKKTMDEEVMSKLSRRASFIDPAHLKGLKLGSSIGKNNESTDSEEDEVVDYADDTSIPKTSTDNGSKHESSRGTAQLDPAVTQLLLSMNERLGALTETVSALSSRVDNMVGNSEQPILMVPQRLHVQMNNRIEDIQNNVGQIDERVQMLANRASSPILMVPQMGSSTR